MKIFRKSVIVLIIFCLTTALAAGSAMAAPKWMENGKMKGWEKPKAQSKVKQQSKVKKQSKVRFNDVAGHWAEQNIVLINSDDVIKGYSDGSFKPNQPVNKEEALTMIARTAYGNITATPVKLKNTKISSWASSSLDLAVKKGIISKVELDTLAFDKPAQRYEVAVWLVRALGLEDKAIDNAGADLDFKDEAAIPVWARAYVKVAVDEGVISGFPGNVFRPGAPVTRAEMATMLVRAQEGFEMPSPRQGFSFVYGVITGIDDDSVTVKRLGSLRNVGTKELTVPVNDEAVIYLEGKLANWEDLGEDDVVTMLLNEDGEAVVILARANSGTDTDESNNDINDGTVEGIVESIGTSSITLKVDGSLQVYTLDSDLIVQIDGEEAELGDIIKGYEVVLTLKDSKVTRIKYDTATKYVSGIVQSLGSNRITVKVNGVLKVYTLDGDIDVELDGKNADPEDLEKGYDVKLTLKNSKVIKIEAESNMVDVSGIVESVGRYSITVKVGGVLKVYTLDGGVDVKVDGKNADLVDIKKGYNVDLTLENNKVIKIEAESNTVDVSGIVESVGTDSITVKVSGVLKVYTLDGDVGVQLDGKNADPEDLKKGYEIKMTVENGKVTEIVAYTGTISGTLESVTTSSITVKVGSSYRVYDLSDDVDVVVNDKDAGLDDLKRGADVRLTLDNDKVVKIVALVIGVEIN